MKKNKKIRDSRKQIAESYKKALIEEKNGLLIFFSSIRELKKMIKS